jgi:phage shock protein PspC (stress-responsive transcriptional regulator)
MAGPVPAVPIAGKPTGIAEGLDVPGTLVKVAGIAALVTGAKYAACVTTGVVPKFAV